MENYLQALWGDQWDDISIDIVRMAMDKLKKMDDEHGVFWVSLIKEDENVLQVDKYLNLLGTFEDDPEITYRGVGKDWQEVEALYQLLLEDKIDAIKSYLTPHIPS